MNKTNKKSKIISQVIIELEGWKKELGDVEVFIANSEETCFDGVGKMFGIKIAATDETMLGIIRSDVVIKPAELL